MENQVFAIIFSLEKDVSGSLTIVFYFTMKVHVINMTLRIIAKGPIITMGFFVIF